MMRQRLICLLAFLLLTVGCAFVTGEKKVDQETGETTYGVSPMVELTTAIGAILGVGAIAVPAARIARNAVRTKNALYDANETALAEADWKKIDSAASFKVVMKAAQDSHDDSVLLKKEFNKWNLKRKKKALKA